MTNVIKLPRFGLFGDRSQDKKQRIEMRKRGYVVLHEDLLNRIWIKKLEEAQK